MLTADRIIAPNQVAKMLETAKHLAETSCLPKRKFYHQTDFYMIAIAYNSGLRISEMSALNWEDIHEDFLIVKNGKGGKKRTVYFGEKTQRIISDFKESRLGFPKSQIKLHHPVFTGERGRLLPIGIHLRFKKLLTQANISETYSFHSLRHGYATRLLDNGVPLSSVRDQLGHVNISITSRYLHLTAESRSKISEIL